jgi:hypothetical protein
MQIYRLRVEQDDNCNPRKDCDHVSKMLCWHRRHSVGDDHQWKRDQPHIAMLALVRECDDTAADKLDPSDTDAILAEFEKHYTYLPVYMYDHSGQTISTKPFGCRWDSGQIGFICVSHIDAHKQFGYPVFKDGGPWNEAKEAKVKEMLEGEVREMDQAMTGEVYWYKIEKLVYEFEQPADEVDADDDDLPWEESDSCGSFYGDDVANNGMSDAGEEFLETFKTAIKNLDEWHLVKIGEPQLAVGDKVYWNDPDEGACSGPGVITKINGDVYSVKKDDGGEVECPFCELTHAAVLTKA